MKIYREESLSNFKFWSGAILNAEQFTPWDSKTGKVIRQKEKSL